MKKLILSITNWMTDDWRNSVIVALTIVGSIVIYDSQMQKPDWDEAWYVTFPLSVMSVVAGVVMVYIFAAMAIAVGFAIYKGGGALLYYVWNYGSDDDDNDSDVTSIDRDRRRSA